MTAAAIGSKLISGTFLVDTHPKTTSSKIHSLASEFFNLSIDEVNENLQIVLNAKYPRLFLKKDGTLTTNFAFNASFAEIETLKAYFVSRQKELGINSYQLCRFYSLLFKFNYLTPPVPFLSEVAIHEKITELKAIKPFSILSAKIAFDKVPPLISLETQLIYLKKELDEYQQEKLAVENKEFFQEETALIPLAIGKASYGSGIVYETVSYKADMIIEALLKEAKSSEPLDLTVLKKIEEFHLSLGESFLQGYFFSLLSRQKDMEALYIELLEDLKAHTTHISISADSFTNLITDPCIDKRAQCLKDLIGFSFCKDGPENLVSAWCEITYQEKLSDSLAIALDEIKFQNVSVRKIFANLKIFENPGKKYKNIGDKLCERHGLTNEQIMFLKSYACLVLKYNRLYLFIEQIETIQKHIAIFSLLAKSLILKPSKLQTTIEKAFALIEASPPLLKELSRTKDIDPFSEVIQAYDKNPEGTAQFTILFINYMQILRALRKSCLHEEPSRLGLFSSLRHVHEQHATIFEALGLGTEIDSEFIFKMKGLKNSMSADCNDSMIFEGVETLKHTLDSISTLSEHSFPKPISPSDA